MTPHERAAEIWRQASAATRETIRRSTVETAERAIRAEFPRLPNDEKRATARALMAVAREVGGG